MPTGAKHGTVIPITQTEYDDLMEQWGVEAGYPTPEEEPIAHYTFDSGINGSSIIDESANANDATVFGNATVVDDSEKGKVLYLDGSSNTYLAMPQGMLDAMDSITISSVFSIKKQMGDKNSCHPDNNFNSKSFGLSLIKI